MNGWRILRRKIATSIVYVVRRVYWSEGKGLDRLNGLHIKCLVNTK